MLSIQTARRLVLMTLLACASGAGEQPAPDAATLSITYIANEGLLLEAGDDAVLIDALFRRGVTGYATVEPKTLEAIETAQPPFDKVRAVLVTHYHADHFHAESVARHLTSNSNAMLITSHQVAEQVRGAKAGGASVKKRILALVPTSDGKSGVSAGSVGFELLKLSHGGGRFADVNNLGYIVHIGDKLILHIGDAHFNDASRGPLKKFAVGVDVACIPYWWLLDEASRTWVTDTLKPKHIVAFHIPPREVADVEQKLRPHLPNVTICAKPGKLDLKP